MLTRRKPLVTVGYLGGVATVHEEFTYSLARMIQYTCEECPQIGIHLDRAKSSYHSLARNTLAKRMRGEWLLQLDTDHELDPDLLIRLLNTAQELDTDVVSGLYRSKVPPHLPVAYLWSDRPGVVRPIAEWDKDVFQVDATGGGCLLVRRSVFDRIRAWLDAEPFDIVHPMGEDISFFDRCRGLKIPVWIDTRIEAHHLKTERVRETELDSVRVNDPVERAAA